MHAHILTLADTSVRPAFSHRLAADLDDDYFDEEDLKDFEFEEEEYFEEEDLEDDYFEDEDLEETALEEDDLFDDDDLEDNFFEEEDLKEDEFEDEDDLIYLDED